MALAYFYINIICKQKKNTFFFKANNKNNKNKLVGQVRLRFFLLGTN